MSRKIGVFCPTLNVCGGGEYVAIAIANTLAQNNRNVILFTNSKVDHKGIKNFFGETLNPSITTVSQPTNFYPRGLADFYQTIIHAFAAKLKCDIFIDAFSNCVYPWTQVSYIHFPHLNQYAFSKTFPYLSAHPSQAGTVPHVILEKQLIDYSKRLILANSYFTAREIQAFSGKPVEVLYPPFSSAISKLGKTANKDPHENLVVTTSRLEPNKLLERIPYIAKQTDPTIQYAIIGRLCNQQTLLNLEALIKKLDLVDRVKVFPNAPGYQKLDLLERAKIYLHTMIGEHFGISIVEAMALGCVPIVHNSGGMTEFVPSQYRYDSIPQAAQMITQEIASWSSEKTEEVKEIAESFSSVNFSLRFMRLFSRYYD